MSINTLETPRPTEAWPADDEIDLRQYLDVLLRWWREIALITLIVAMLAGLGILATRLVTSPVYVATAGVAIARTVSNVSFDERFQTMSDEIGSDTISASARRSALMGLVTTGGIANEVVAELGDLLSEEELDPAYLIEQIDAAPGPVTGARTDSDLIRISATADSPEKAAAIANAWANAYVRQINTVYGQVPNAVLNSIQAELAVAEQTYLEAQSRLETFLAENQIKDLNSLLTVLQQRVDQEVILVQAHLTEWQYTNEQLATARSLRTQLEEGGDGAVRSTMAALQTLKITVYGKPPATLQLELRDMPEVTLEAMLADVDGLIASLEEKLIDLEQEITARSNGLRPEESGAGTSANAFAPTYKEIRQLQARIEAETARKIQLEQQRNLSWEAYKALSNKITELNLTRAASSSEVRFAAPAVPPAEPVKGIGLVVGIGTAAFVGLFLAMLGAFLSHYLGLPPFLRRQVSH